MTDNADNPQPTASMLLETVCDTSKVGVLGMHALVGGVAHAFNNLLTSTIGNLELAIAALPSEIHAVRDDLNFALADAHKMAELCHRTISHCGIGVFQMARLDLRSVIESAAARLTGETPAHVELRINSGSWPIWVSGEARLLESMTVNLIRNAFDASRHDGSIVTVSSLLAKIDERFASDHFMETELKPGEYAAIEVTDTGYGMDAVITRKAFMPLFSTKGLGRGLGLTEVQGIVLIHRGAIAVDTEVGKGSTFKVLLPIYEDRSSAHSALPTAPDLPRAVCRGNVLIIDDAPGVRRYVGRMLERMGFNAFMAGDGQEGIERFREHADEICLVLLDVFMPRMDGDSVLQELRRIRPKVNVLLMSGYQEAALLEKFSKEETATLLFKPFATNDFVARVEKALQTTKTKVDVHGV